MLGPTLCPGDEGGGGGGTKRRIGWRCEALMHGTCNILLEFSVGVQY